MADKSRYFAFVVYEESAIDDWRTALKKSFGEYAISPLHSADEDYGKPHWHVIYHHPNVVTVEAATRCIPAGVAANGHIEIVHHPRQYQRYLIHLDNPEKEQFEEGKNAIELINRFPLDLKRELSRSELNEVRKKIFEWIRDNDLDEYSTLLDSLDVLGDPDMFEYAFSHTIAFNAYLKSKRHRSG